MTKLADPIKTRSNIRNISIIAHVDAGKSTLTERILSETGKIKKVGEVHDGEATMDFDEQERARGITINSAATSFPFELTDPEFPIIWHDRYHFNLIDTPGHVDFAIEVVRAIESGECCVVVICAAGRVQAQTPVVFSFAKKNKNVPIIFVNKMDRSGADFNEARKQIIEKMHVNPYTITIPVGCGDSFSGYINIITGQYFSFKKGSSKFSIDPIPSDMIEEVKKERYNLCEEVVDEDLLDEFVDNGDLSNEDLFRLVRLSAISGNGIPLICGAAYKNIGARLVLETAILFCPSPLERPEMEIRDLKNNCKKIVDFSSNEELIACIFKVVKDDFCGFMCYVRIYSGILKAGMTVFCSRLNKKIRITKLVEVHANERIPITEIRKGNIGAILTGDLRTGDTLCIPGDSFDISLTAPSMPVISRTIIPKKSSDTEKLSKALRIMGTEDGSFHYEFGKKVIISGSGELHLEVKLYELEHKYKIGFMLGDPIIKYLETIDFTGVEYSHTHKKQSGGSGQFGKILFRVEKLDLEEYPSIIEEGGLIFVDKVVGGRIPKEYIPSIKKGFLQAMSRGQLIGEKVVGVRITLLDGDYHAVDSSTLAFEITARNGLVTLLKKEKSILLQPLMSVSISMQDQYLGTITGDVSRRKGIIVNSESSNGISVITAIMPLRLIANNYISWLRSNSKGTAAYSAVFLKYSPVYSSEAEEIIQHFS